MKNETNPPRQAVRLEPDLEQIAGTFDAGQCRALAALYRRWSRQLSVKAKVLETRAAPRPAGVLRPLAARRLALIEALDLGGELGGGGSLGAGGEGLGAKGAGVEADAVVGGDAVDSVEEGAGIEAGGDGFEDEGEIGRGGGRGGKSVAAGERGVGEAVVFGVGALDFFHFVHDPFLDFLAAILEFGEVGAVQGDQGGEGELAEAEAPAGGAQLFDIWVLTHVE